MKLAGAWEETDAEINELPLREPGRFGVLFEQQADEIIRYAHARLGLDLAQRTCPSPRWPFSCAARPRPAAASGRAMRPARFSPGRPR